MKLYSTAIGPNPRIIRMALAVKDMDIETHEIDMLKMENRREDFLKINPAGQLPCLVTDDGRLIAETTAMIEYIEEIKPDPVLVGDTATERGETRMWMRRADYMVIIPMANGYRHAEGAEFFAGRIPIHGDIAPPSKAMAKEGLTWFDAQLVSREFLCGARFSYADIVFYCLVSFFARVGQPLDAYPHVVAYLERVAAYNDLGQVK